MTIYKNSATIQLKTLAAIFYTSISLKPALIYDKATAIFKLLKLCNQTFQGLLPYGNSAHSEGLVGFKSA